MNKSLKLIQNHSQLKELGNPLKYSILKELIKEPATCQQLATLFNHSKQKIHYTLNQMVDQGLLELTQGNNGNHKEVYYQAAAKNFVLDFAIGLEAGEGVLDSQAIIGGILEHDHRISLQAVAAKLIDESFKLTRGDRLLITTGKFNFPLVEKLLLEAGKRGIHTSLLYQDLDLIKARNEDYSLAAYRADYEEFNRLLKNSDMYLNLNGEARFTELKDRDKLRLRNRLLAKGRKIIASKKIKLASMPSLMNDTLSDHAIQSELQFWRALDIDYGKLDEYTMDICRQIAAIQSVNLLSGGEEISFAIDRVWAESGSFGESEFQTHIINLPGGEVMMVPKPGSINGTIVGDRAFAFGKEIIKPRLVIQANEIQSFTAQENEDVLQRAIDAGGVDGREIALVCLGTNTNILRGNIDNALQHKSDGFLSFFWGNNQALGGTVRGDQEWIVQIEKPILNYI
ncbi:MAG: aminopeptidase [Candidatus Cloacimonadaceae bacterium]